MRPSTTDRWRIAPVAVALILAGLSAAGTCANQASRASQYRSRICIYDLRSKSVRAVYTGDGVFEAPNWSPDGKYLLVNSRGRLLRMPFDGSDRLQPVELALSQEYTCNNDKALSPDGKLLAFSASTPASRGSQVFLAGADGSAPRLIVP